AEESIQTTKESDHVERNETPKPPRQPLHCGARKEQSERTSKEQCGARQGNLGQPRESPENHESRDHSASDKNRSKPWPFLNSAMHVLPIGPANVPAFSCERQRAA